MEEKPSPASVSHLKQLVLGDDESPMSIDNHEHTNKRSLLDENTPIPKTRLGKSLDELMVTWSQLMTNISSKPPVPPPSAPEHAKEVAELWVKEWRDAAHDMNTELTRICLQWELEHPGEKHVDELKDIDEALKRQDTLLQRCQSVLENRTDVFFSKPK